MDKDIKESLKSLWLHLPVKFKLFFIILSVVFIISFIFFVRYFGDGLEEYLSM